MDTEFLKELILDHARNPRNNRRLSSADWECLGENPLCGDQVSIQVVIKNDHLIELAFTGRGCALSQASASLLTESCAGLDKQSALVIANAFRDTIISGNQSQFTNSLNTTWNNVEPLTAISANPARVKCILLAWHTLKHALIGETSTCIDRD